MNAATRWAGMLGATTLLALAAGCATTDEAKAARDTARLQSLQHELIARGDPDSLAAGALFARILAPSGNLKPIDPTSNATALDLASRAASAAPDRPELVLEQLQLCQEIPSCNQEALESRLRELDPQNGISWTYAMLRAERADDWEALRRERADLARAQRVDWYWNRTVSHLAAAATGRAGFGSGEALAEVIGIEAAFMTALQPVSKACSAQEIEQPEALAQCRLIAAAFRRADVYIFESYGTGLALRLWPEGTPERAQIAAERRAIHYWLDMGTRYPSRLSSPAAFRILATLYAQYPTEQEVFRALFVRSGLKPDPPADWLDRTPGG
jgi:hypothetical protein